MTEICTPPIIGTDENGDETVTFTAGHSWADVVRWIAENPADLAEVQLVFRSILEERRDD